MIATTGQYLFEMISAPTRDWLAQLGSRKVYQDGELIHSRGDRSPTMCIVIAGVVRLGRLRKDGGRTFAGVVSAGQHFGDILMKRGHVRTHDAVADGLTEIDHYDRSSFEQILTNHEVLRALYDIASQRLGQSIAMHDDLRGLTRHAHLAKVLLQQWALNGKKQSLPCLQDDLAAVLGVTPMTLSKGIAQLKREGLIETGYREIRILDPQGLRAWLNERVSD